MTQAQVSASSAPGRAAGRRRAKLAALSVAFAALGLLAAGIEAWVSRPPAPPAALDALAFPGFASIADKLATVTVTTQEGTYHVERDGDVWRLREMAGHPVQAAVLRQVVQGLGALRLVRSMTRDVAKHERLGVADPASGGNGVVLELADSAGGVLAHLVLGRSDTDLHVRRPDSPEVFAATGDLPDLSRAVAWLDLTAGRVAREAITRVEVRPPLGEAYILVPQGEFGDFLPERPGIALENAFIGNPVGIALSVLAPIEVRAAGSLKQEPVSEHITHLSSGLRIRALAFVEPGLAGDSYWLGLSAEGPGAEAYNVRVSAYVYGLERFDWVDYATSLAELQGRPR